ncbi:hypothetical protein K1X22_23995 [Mycolicibacterium farcinogenes]|uniref:hypothetical protein n=1 Tax=Mycolicibacterium farcinogenes TaxID=1802 RepID=UPI001C8DDD70|nr:hypothetical protein [Mycolicibacterium farcinogenes]QZH59242.1 hypothetical protein K1X22_23995 [Mycolicibacterium farcinogenes]
MTISNTTNNSLAAVANFPPNYFLENIAVRTDGSILVTALNHSELWYLPAPTSAIPVEPILIATLDGLTMGIVEAEPDIFYVGTLGDPALYRFDFREWTPGGAVPTCRVLTFAPDSAGPNGSCLLAPNVIVVADCVEGLIWRVDLSDDGLSATAKPWLQHASMAPSYTDPFAPVVLSNTVQIPMPGVNGVRYAASTGHLYYTGSAAESFLRVTVDPRTYEPKGAPELIAEGIHAVDDFCLDERSGSPTSRPTSTTRSIGFRYSQAAGRSGRSSRVIRSLIRWWARRALSGDGRRVTTGGSLTSPPMVDMPSRLPTGSCGRPKLCVLLSGMKRCPARNPTM